MNKHDIINYEQYMAMQREVGDLKRQVQRLQEERDGLRLHYEKIWAGQVAEAVRQRDAARCELGRIKKASGIVSQSQARRIIESDQ